MALAHSKPVHANPVYGSYFADPFVWKHNGTYYAIGTGALEASGQTIGKIFPVLQSDDFFQWSFASNAMLRPDRELGTHFWAPEVAVRDGIFHLYYSVGQGDAHHQLRVALSDSPQGPYYDTGKTLLDPRACSFAIDPHPFQDDDGQWYLFYACDFLNVTPNARAGTGLMVVRMNSMTELADEGQAVVRPRSDWQRFQAGRPLYGRVWDWHTIEGPFVRKQDGRYYCFYSAGRWETEHYGVDFAVAEHVTGPYSDVGNESGPRVLRTVPGQVLGPGHCSIAAGPDDGPEYLIYHAWGKDMKARQMFMDRLLWTANGPRCDGPTRGAGFR